MDNLENNWLEEVASRVGGMETPAPEGAWEAVSGAVSRIKGRRRRARAIVVAALAAAAALAPIVILQNGKGPETDISGVSVASATSVASAPSVQAVAADPAVEDIGNDKPKTIIPSKNLVAENAVDGTDNIGPAHKEEVAAPVSAVAVDEPLKKEEVSDSVPEDEPSNPRETDFQRRLAELGGDDAVKRPRGRSGFSLGGNLAMASGARTADLWNNDIVNASTAATDGFYGLSLVRKAPGSVRQSAFRYRHMQPVSIKLAYALPLYGGLSAETGLTYTVLRSSVLSYDTNGEYAGTQVLQFVGIPLNLGWTLFESGRSSLYLLSGGEARKCVKARMERTPLEIKPVFWSVSASAGYQFNLAPRAGLFVEAGGSWHFRNEAFNYTLYDNNPLQFSLQAGLRIRK